MSHGILIQWELLVGLGIPATGAMIAIIRHLWNKSKCFVILKQKIEQLTDHDEGASDTHSDLYDKVNKIEKNLFHLMGKMNVTPID